MCMYIESLIIKNYNNIIRNIKFKKDVNIIADNTKGLLVENDKETTNSIGKTTVLKLIDICLGAEIDIVYTDSETRRNQDTIVKSFIEENDVKIELVLSRDNEEYRLVRNLTDKSYYINDKSYKKKDYEQKVTDLFFPNLKIGGKPTFRQLCKKNIRIDENAINNVLSFLHSKTSDAAYEPVHLFLLGININLSDKSQYIKDIKSYERIIKELSKKESVEKLQQLFDLVLEEIDKKEKKISYYKEDEQIRFEEIANELNQLQLLLKEAEIKLNNDEFSFNVAKNISEQFNDDLFKETDRVVLKIYEEYEQYFQPALNLFNQFVEFHTSITNQKINFNEDIIEKKQNQVIEGRKIVDNFKMQINEKRKLVESSREYVAFDKLKNDLEKLYVQKGRYEEAIITIKDKQEEINRIKKKIEEIDNQISNNMKLIEKNIADFNEYYGYFSNELYGETYKLLYEFSNGVFKMSSITVSGTSSGKKQGEILCFDMAYILFARSKGIPHIEFILNDKKELLSISQISKAIQLAEKYNIQLVFSILSDKLSSIYNKVESKIILKLSDKDKLFKI